MFLDGDHDWMDPLGGMQSVEALRQAGNGEGKMYIVNNAGHHRKSSHSLEIFVTNTLHSVP
jgi:cardiolipin-specific phospholipase